MHRFQKALSLLLACFLILNILRMPVLAADESSGGDLEVVDDSSAEIPEVIIEDSEITIEEDPENVSFEVPEEAASEAPEEVPQETTPVEIPQRTDYQTVPLYLQTDYPDVYYDGGTVATSGCSMASLAMVATYLTGYEYLPDTLARYFAYEGDSNIARLEFGSNALHLPYEKNWDWHVTLQALKEGKIAIILLSSDSQFTYSQHFVVLTGVTEDGRILVNDPYGPNYEHWALKQGFENGFTEDMIICGFQGAWVYDKDTLPTQTFYYEESETPVEAVPFYEQELPEPVDPADVPLYFQNDYPNVRYAGGTVATSGCSVTSLAMVASYLTDHAYMPDELARYFGGRAENHIARIELGSETLGLPYEKNTNWHTTLKALRDGKVAIVLVDENTNFTQTQHFLVLTSLTSDGKVMVNDSWESNYSHWALEDGFVNGFHPDEIMKGFQGAWVYDKSAMPQDPIIYYDPEPLRDESRYEGLTLTLEEEDLLAKVIWAEARGESAEGQQAVAEVVLNRLVSEDFPNTLNDIIYDEGQFRSVPQLKDADPSQAQYEALEAALYGPNILPMDVYYFATWETNASVWGQIDNHIFCYAE